MAEDTSNGKDAKDADLQDFAVPSIEEQRGQSITAQDGELDRSEVDSVRAVDEASKATGSDAQQQHFSLPSENRVECKSEVETSSSADHQSHLRSAAALEVIKTGQNDGAGVLSKGKGVRPKKKSDMKRKCEDSAVRNESPCSSDDEAAIGDLDLRMADGIPIFTREFLAHNKQQELHLKKLRKGVVDIEDERNNLSKHLEMLQSETEAMQKETTELVELNGQLERAHELIVEQISTALQSMDSELTRKLVADLSSKVNRRNAARKFVRLCLSQSKGSKLADSDLDFIEHFRSALRDKEFAC